MGARGMISDCLKNHFLFSSLTDDDRDMVITAFAPEKFSEGAEIISQGEKHAEMRHTFSPYAQGVDDVNNHVAICKNIVKNQLKFPSGCSSTPCAKLIQGLLTTQPHMRLGCMANGANDIKNHEFFKGLSWNKLLMKEIDAPWIPKLKSKKDTTMFDEIPEDENVREYRNDDPSGWEKDF